MHLCRLTSSWLYRGLFWSSSRHNLRFMMLLDDEDSWLIRVNNSKTEVDDSFHVGDALSCFVLGYNIRRQKGYPEPDFYDCFRVVPLMCSQPPPQFHSWWISSTAMMISSWAWTCKPYSQYKIRWSHGLYIQGKTLYQLYHLNTHLFTYVYMMPRMNEFMWLDKFVSSTSVNKYTSKWILTSRCVVPKSWMIKKHQRVTWNVSRLSGFAPCLFYPIVNFEFSKYRRHGTRMKSTRRPSATIA